MRRFQRILIAVGLLASASMIAAGCATRSSLAPAPVGSDLKKLAPAAAPVTTPTIPPDAARVPRPAYQY